MRSSVLEQWNKRKAAIEAAKNRDRFEKTRWDRASISQVALEGELGFSTEVVPVTFYPSNSGSAETIARSDILHQGHPWVWAANEDAVPDVSVTQLLTGSNTAGSTTINIVNAGNELVMNGIQVTINSTTYVVTGGSCTTSRGGAQMRISPPLIENTSLYQYNIIVDEIKTGVLCFNNEDNKFLQVVNGEWEAVTHTYVKDTSDEFPTASSVPVGTLAVALEEQVEIPDTDPVEYTTDVVIFWNKDGTWTEFGTGTGTDHPVEDIDVSGTTVLRHIASGRWLSHFE